MDVSGYRHNYDSFYEKTSFQMSINRVGRSRSGPVFGTPFSPSLGLGLGPVSVHLGHGLVRS